MLVGLQQGFGYVIALVPAEAAWLLNVKFTPEMIFLSLCEISAMSCALTVFKSEILLSDV